MRPERIGSEVIMMMEPDPTLARMAGSVLESAGYRVMRAQNGVECLKLSYEIFPRLLVLDIGCFQQESLGLVENLRTLNSDASLPVIATSIYPLGRSIQRSYGITSFLQKPYDMKQLLYEVQNVFSAPSPGGATTDLHLPTF